MAAEGLSLSSGSGVERKQEARVTDERERLRKQLAEAESNLRLVRERMAEFPMQTEVSLQYVKQAEDWEARIAALRDELARGSGLCLMRAPVADFTGRAEEINVLVAHLSQGGTTAQITGIRGMGGVGKTELALVVAARLLERYPDAQLMVELQPGDQPLTPEKVLAGVVRTFLPGLELPDELAELQHLYHRALTGKRGLLLLDNAAGPEQVRPLVPAPAGWAVVVTSRARFPLSGARLCNLDLLPLGDAVALLRRLLADGAREEGAEGEETSPLRELAELCGRLPLALRVAAGHLTSYPDVMLSRYLTELRAARLAHLDAPGEPDVAAVLGLSVARLEKDDAELARRWRELAVCVLPFDWATAAAVWGVLTTVPTPGIDEDERIRLAPLSEGETRRSLSVLVQRNLLEYDAATERFSLHELLRAWVLEGPAGSADLEGALRRYGRYLSSEFTAAFESKLGPFAVEVMTVIRNRLLRSVSRHRSLVDRCAGGRDERVEDAGGCAYVPGSVGQVMVEVQGDVGVVPDGV